MRKGAARLVTVRVLAAGTALLAGGTPVLAQELSPRAYWPAPAGTRVAVVGYAYTSGDIVTDPSLPVTGVDSRLEKFLLAYLHTFSFFGRTSTLVFELPYAWGETTGEIDGEMRRRDLSNVGDLGVTWSINLIGAPSLTPADFRQLRAAPHPILAWSTRILAPTGKYDGERLINVGANRWAVKGEFGYIYPLRASLFLELELGAWFFSDNDEFLGRKREQEPIGAVEIHLIKELPSGTWASIEANFFTGGRTIVDGARRDDLQRNSTLGATIVWPFRKGHAIKLGFNTGVVTESGGDFATVLMSYLVQLN